MWLILGAVPLAAQRPSVEAVCITQPPVLDGELDDPCWQQAAKITDLKEMETAGEPEEPTSFWLAYDAQFIYLAAYAKDSQPGSIRADQQKRGGNLGNDDVVEITIDTYRSHTDAYWFIFNAIGTQFERIPEGSAGKTEWRGDWEVATRIVDDGWMGEARIPFSMLRYPEGATGFCVVLARRLAREGEWYTWPWVGHWDQQKSADWGPLRTPKPKPRVCTMAYAVAEHNEGNSSLDVGLDAKCTMPDGMVAQVTVNPDFVNVEQQVEGIDFTYTERRLSDARPFFAEGRGFYPSDRHLYTRRLENIDVGLKWFGRSGEHRTGLLHAMDAGHRYTTAAHWSWDYRPYSAVGAMAVLDDNEGSFDSTYGVGVSYFDPVGERGRKGASLEVETSTVLGGSGTREAFNVGGSYRSGGGHTATWLRYQRVDEGYAPAVGFYPESGFDGFRWGFRRKDWSRDGRVRRTWWRVNLSDRDALGGGTYDRTIGFGGGLETRDWLGVHVSYYETKRPPYADHTAALSVWWNGDDPYRRGGAGFTIGKRENGDYRYFRLSQGFRPSDDLSLQASGSWVSHDAPSGHCSDRQIVLSANYDLDPERSIGARFVDGAGGLNAYASYRQKVRQGTDVSVILGDPNASKTAERIAVKTVRTL